MIDPNYRILSDEAAVVSGRVKCWNCRADIEVVCLYCQTGFIDGEPTLDFSVSNITDVDESLRLQLARWPKFHPIRRLGSGDGYFANHCPSCEKPQDDFYLHCQPGGLFFSFQDPVAQELRIHALTGLVRFSGDEGFEP
ncbi:MAG TPA: hypothetical protein VK696_02090 [Steroidobacteraceae bacterium]|jgi:hypothetical protein|nr:hypothetical protein [Steroidobacteraceae bacterium]